jgi:tRNA(Ile)-lysidine synthase TilS/MesJ
VLPENFPTVHIDSEGICNYCRAYQNEQYKDEDKNRYLEKFKRLIQEKAGSAMYDIIVAYSGGKDSTYTLELLKNKYGLCVLAFTFDNGFVSQRAFDNMRRVVDNLGIDHMIFKADFSMLKKVFISSIHTNPYSKKSLERASTICTTCMLFVKAAILKAAIEKKIPFIGYGWSPGQAPIQSSVIRMSPAFLRAAQNSACESLQGVAGEIPKRYFLNDHDYAEGDKFPYNVHPLAFEYYDEEHIYEHIKNLGWLPPDDTDPNSTNCILNAFAIHIHKDQFKFHPYAFEISGLVRAGIMQRSEGINRLYAPDNMRIVEEVRKRLSAE